MNTSASVTTSVYPRSRLFRNYEAQQLSATKTYPRSRLFLRYECEQAKQKIQYQTVQLQAKHNAQNNQIKTEEWDDDDEMDFSDKSFFINN
jgi:cell division septum initiation protein DivIVA